MATDGQQNWIRRVVLGNENLPDPDFPISHVPDTERKGIVSIAAVLLGFVFFAGTLFGGAEVGAAIGFVPMLAAMFIGYTILGVYVAILCGIAAKAGLTAVLLARYTFGSYGAKFVSLLLGGTQVGWFGVTIPLIAGPTASYFGLTGSLGGIIDITAAVILIWGFFHLITAYYGYEGMEKLSLVAVPALVIVGLLSIGIAVQDVGGVAELIGQGGGGEMTFAGAVTVVVGTFISGGTQAPNWARFARDHRVGFWAGLIAFLLGNGFLFLSGAVGGAVYADTAGGLFGVLTAQGLALVGLIALMLNIWTTNDSAAYAFGVAGSEVFNFDRKRPFVLAGGAVGIAVALAGAGSLLIPWLSTLGQYVPPLGGVIIADFLVCRRMDIPHMDDIEFTGLRGTAIIAYSVGGIVAIFTAGQVIPGVPAPAIIPGPVGASLNGLITAFIMQVLAYYGLENQGVLSGHVVDPDAELL